MQYRVYSGNTTNYTNWQQVVNLSNSEPIAQGEVTDGQLFWSRPETENEDDRIGYASVIWSGYFVQPKEGAVRFQVRGFPSALAINGIQN